ncbi:hypothetical protein ABT144_34255 [Streptomyces sp. NPDC002039]|uniref:hypothetical protein n=1 Tax=Streptomyces sp. NPDC002039 TaxID=3154660 RepID=UPI00331FE8A7
MQHSLPTEPSIEQLGALQSQAGGGQSSVAAGRVADHPEVEHPLVLTDPVTGARSLLLGSMVIRCVTGLSDQDSRAMIDDLLEHTTSEPYLRHCTPTFRSRAPKPSTSCCASCRRRPKPPASRTTSDGTPTPRTPDFVARHLRTGEYLDQALDALARFTRYFSAEVAVRDFLNDFPTRR